MDGRMGGCVGDWERAAGAWVLALGARQAGPGWVVGVPITLASGHADRGVAPEPRAGPQ